MKTWTPVVGDYIAQVGHWDLFNMSDLEWQRRKEIINQVLQVLLRPSGIGVPRLTKALHRQWPNLISICDSVIQKVLGITTGSEDERVVACTDEFRPIGRKAYMCIAQTSETIEATANRNDGIANTGAIVLGSLRAFLTS